MLVRRAEEAGFKAITLTVDTPTPSPKERDLRNRYNRNFEQGNFPGRQPAGERAAGHR